MGKTYFRHYGNFSKTMKFLNHILKKDYLNLLSNEVGLSVDNDYLTGLINFGVVKEEETINLNEELIPYLVEFSCGLNGFFGCTSEYYIDNLKITYKEDEWQH